MTVIARATCKTSAHSHVHQPRKRALHPPSTTIVATRRGNPYVLEITLAATATMIAPTCAIPQISISDEIACRQCKIRVSDVGPRAISRWLSSLRVPQSTRGRELGIELVPGIDEVSLALVADAWSRTYRSRALTIAANAAAVETRNGLRIIPDRVGDEWPEARLLAGAVNRPPARALDDALDGIEQRYGARTSSIVAIQLEYRRQQARP